MNMEKKPLPDNLVDLQKIVDDLYEEYKDPANTREDRFDIRTEYQEAAQKYNRLAGRGVYLLNINLQTAAKQNDKIK